MKKPFLLKNSVKYGKIFNRIQSGFYMQEIINSINEAEEKAAEIKAAAIKKAAEIAENAENRSAEILALSEAECKALREKSIKTAKEQARKNYESEITVKRAESAQYRAERIKNIDKIVNDIVRRITRGGC